MLETGVENALEGLADFFQGRQTRAGVVARRLLGMPAGGDASLTDQLIRERRRKTRLDGSLDGSLTATAWGARELVQLGGTRDHTGLHRMVGFLLSRQDQPGRFGEGCSERRHEIAHCKHYLSGFFSPGGTDEPQAPLTLPTGAVIAPEFGARFVASCVALRAALASGEEEREPIRKHLESLLLLATRWHDLGEFPKSMDVVFCATGALAAAPPSYRKEVDEVLQNVMLLQQPDGQWPGVSLFHALDGLQHAANPATISACNKAVAPLLQMQRPDGSFDEANDEELALIALRTIRTYAGPKTAARRRQSMPSKKSPVRHS